MNETYTGEVPPATPQPSRRRKWIVILVSIPLVPVLGILIAYAIYHYHAESQLQEALAEADRLDPGWRLEDLEAKRAVIADEENSANLVLAAHRLMPPRWPDFPSDDPEKIGAAFDLRYRLSRVPPSARLDDEMAHSLELALEQAEPALWEARQLAKRPRGRFAVDWKSDYFTTVLQGSKVREFSDLLYFGILLQAHQGDMRGALSSCRALLNAFRAIGDEPSLISMMVRKAGQNMTASYTERVLGQGQAEDADLVQLQKLLEDEATHDVLLIGLRGERAGAHHFNESMASGASPIQSLRDFMILPGDQPPTLFDEVDWQTPAGRTRRRAALLRLQTALIEIAKLPLPDQATALMAWKAKVVEAPYVTRQSAEFLEKAFGTNQYSQTKLRCAITALAVERYRLHHGSWPQSLNDLRPQFLTQVPVDPYAGQPLRYRRLADSVVIYSVGPDGQDDGGNIQRTKPPQEPGTDQGFQLWEVEKRRQPAKTEPKKDL